MVPKKFKKNYSFLSGRILAVSCLAQSQVQIRLSGVESLILAMLRICSWAVIPFPAIGTDALDSVCDDPRRGP